MQVFTADALVLRTYRYGEADRIVVFLTEDRGKKRGVARNASASRRRFGAALEPLTRGRATYVERENRELVRLDRVEPSGSPLGSTAGRSSDDRVDALGHASYFAELIDEWAPDASPNERLFRLGTAVADALGRGGSVAALARYFEYWLLRLEGVYPALDRCPRCGRAAFAEGAALVLAERAYVCLTCTSGGLRLSAAAVGFVRTALARPPDRPPGVLDELEEVHQRLIALHLERDVRSLRVLKELRSEL
jgi:DNA repair protein RecO (recombination protein O)